MPLEASNKRNIVSFYGRSGKSFLKCTFAQGRNVKSFLKCTFAQGRNGKSNLKNGFVPGPKWQIIFEMHFCPGPKWQIKFEKWFQPRDEVANHFLNCTFAQGRNITLNRTLLNLIIDQLI